MNSSNLWTFGSFIFFIVIGLGAWWAVGSVYGEANAMQLITSLTDSGLYLASTGAGASATILALMLTLLGMVHRMDAVDFDKSLAAQIRRISKFATLALMLSLVLLLMMVFPVGEYKELPQQWFYYLYNAMFLMTVLVLASLSMTVMSVYLTIKTVIGGVRDYQEQD